MLIIMDEELREGAVGGRRGYSYIFSKCHLVVVVVVAAAALGCLET
jgi:hypothetical protein